MGMPFLFQVHGGWHSLGITQGEFVVLYFSYSYANAFTRKIVKLRALQVRRFINGVHILFGRLTAQKRRLPDFMTIPPYVPDNSTFSFIVRIFRSLANSSSMSRHFFMTASIVCHSFRVLLLLMLTYLRIVLFYILTDAKSSEDHILGFFSKVSLSSNLATFANSKSRKRCRMTVTTLLVS